MRDSPLRLLAATAAVAMLVAGAALASSSVRVGSAQTGALGTILVVSGHTLYHDAAEARNAVKCTGSCALTWPPLLVGPGMKPVAGSGVRASLLGTIKRPDGKLQVTYAGKPLYLYSGDSKPGQANGQGVNQAWYAITPSGSVTTKPGTSKSTPSGSSKSSGTGSSSGTGGASTTTGTSGSGSGGSNGAGTTTSSSSNNAAICAADPMDCNNGVPIT